MSCLENGPWAGVGGARRGKEENGAFEEDGISKSLVILSKTEGLSSRASFGDSLPSFFLPVSKTVKSMFDLGKPLKGTPSAFLLPVEAVQWDRKRDLVDAANRVC